MDFLIDNEIVVDYVKGNVVLFNNDCKKILEKMENECIDLFVSDIPYRISKKGTTKKKEGKKYMSGIFDCYESTEENITNIKRGKIFRNNDIKIKEYIGEVYRVLKNGSHCYLFSNWSNLNDIITESEKVGFKLQNILVWGKDNKVCNKYYMNQCEYILFFRKR